jgi:5-formyltetrahydrofolate cyclo-ligase
MTLDLKGQKALLRRQMRQVLERLSGAARAEASRQVCASLRRKAAWTRARFILFFAPLPDEIDIFPLLTTAIEEGKSVALPRYIEADRAYSVSRVADPVGDLERGRYGIREPRASCPGVALNRLDLVLVPGVAFTVAGRRLGRGMGYYDRLLRSVGGMKCGVGFDEQVVPEIPAEPHDVELDLIVTPSRWCRASQRAGLK